MIKIGPTQIRSGSRRRGRFVGRSNELRSLRRKQERTASPLGSILWRKLSSSVRGSSPEGQVEGKSSISRSDQSDYFRHRELHETNSSLCRNNSLGGKHTSRETKHNGFLARRGIRSRFPFFFQSFFLDNFFVISLNF